MTKATTKREQMVECADKIEDGMVQIGFTKEIWQNDLIWWLCNAVRLLLLDKIKELK